MSYDNKIVVVQATNQHDNKQTKHILWLSPNWQWVRCEKCNYLLIAMFEIPISLFFVGSHGRLCQCDKENITTLFNPSYYLYSIYLSLLLPVAKHVSYKSWMTSRDILMLLVFCLRMHKVQMKVKFVFFFRWNHILFNALVDAARYSL